MYTFLSDEFLVMKCRVRPLSRQIIETPWNLKTRNSRVLTTVSVFFSRGKDQKYSFRFRRDTMRIRYVLCQPPKFGEGNYRALKDFPFPPAICRGKFNIYYGRFETLCNSVLTSEPDKSKSPWNFYHFNLTRSGFERSIYLFTRVRHKGRCVLSARSAVVVHKNFIAIPRYSGRITRISL